mmetsp:Transcript_74768/g.86808  ORF Transcript_74768/g.86808 Transcript_74768/m.86808 type:complete len:167 (-) Transcript_74768:43-543(-)
MSSKTASSQQPQPDKKAPEWVKGFKKSQLISFIIHTVLMFTLPVIVYFQACYYFVQWGYATEATKDIYGGGAAIVTVNLIIFSFVFFVYMDPDSFVDQTDPTKARTMGGNLIPDMSQQRPKAGGAANAQDKAAVTEIPAKKTEEDEAKPAGKKKYSERKKTHEKTD